MSNRLPVSVREEHGNLTLSRSNGGLATALASLFDQNTSLWVGWTGLRRRLSGQRLKELDFPPYLLPINLTKNEIAGYYDGFSNSVLWPLAHGLSKNSRHTTVLWQDYYRVNKKFAKAISSVVRPDDLIWVHDYHLFLLPQLLREMGVTNKIGFFLHTPFFSAEAIAKTGHNNELLHGILAADFIGLQTAADVTRFHNTLRAAHIAQTPNVQVLPIGIDFDQFNELANDDEVGRMTHEHKQVLAGKTVIFSLSRLDYTKGILTQLDAFERLLKTVDKPENIIYRLNVAPSREEVREYHRLKNQIERRVNRINTRYAQQPVWYSYDNMGIKEMTAWYRVGDIHLNVPIADGMNLIAKEYVAAKQSPGILVISNTMGAAAQLKDALMVPPSDTKLIAAALQTALLMPANERQARWNRLRKQVKDTQAKDWATKFLTELQKDTP